MKKHKPPARHPIYHDGGPYSKREFDEWYDDNYMPFGGAFRGVRGSLMFVTMIAAIAFYIYVLIDIAIDKNRRATINSGPAAETRVK